MEQEVTSTHDDLRQTLKQHFGYDEFRPMQLEVINKVLEGKDALTVMPTGGGKSLCYQIPALKLPGLTLVISPLISLMKDQVDALKARGIPAEYMNSSLTPTESLRIELGLINGNIKLLYVAPERLNSETFMRLMMTSQISLIAVDEAHCISEWGHDFRPSYRGLITLREKFPSAPMIALTATATERVKKDIISQLGLKHPEIFISSFDRKNLKLKVYRKNNSFETIRKILESRPGESAIVYCYSRKEVENISEKLNYHGINALPYHAGLTTEERKKNQELFINNEADVIVATVAFGMGIDKPDVRIVIHQTFPKTLEGYYQEIGRAGRDGKPSECILFYSYGDKHKHDFFIDKLEEPESKERESMKMEQVMKYCETRLCRRKFLLGYFGEDFERDNCGGCDVCC